MSELNAMERIGLYGGAALLLVGTVGMGLLEIIAGAPHPVSGEGQVVHETVISLSVRSYTILLGLVLLAAYGISNLATKPPRDTSI
ncbi:hypothetical protein [Halorubrum yunnanense]|uniref:DUF998 domain-containing protein n=1 Tax=Halorubrum yunnanense TaxID=1526162 RepID=A0ABD5YH15_9EURY|nr:hypothetical protein [Halorubrum yunnanense]